MHHSYITADCSTPEPELLARLAAKRAAARQRGMTLIEIMVVVAIISLILGGVGLMAFSRFKEAQSSTAEKDVTQIQSAVEMYMMQKKGKCPKTLQDLKASGAIAKTIKDPWGNDYELTCPGKSASVDVVSAGPDGELGTEDDISNSDDASSDKEADK